MNNKIALFAALSVFVLSSLPSIGGTTHIVQEEAQPAKASPNPVVYNLILTEVQSVGLPKAYIEKLKPLAHEIACDYNNPKVLHAVGEKIHAQIPRPYCKNRQLGELSFEELRIKLLMLAVKCFYEADKLLGGHKDSYEFLVKTAKDQKLRPAEGDTPGIRQDKERILNLLQEYQA